MIIRRVELRDYFIESDNGAPTAQWTAVDGTWAIASRKLNHAGGGPPPTADGTVYKTVAWAQGEKLCYDIKMEPTVLGADWSFGLIIQADAIAGRYLGNSYVLELTAAATKIQESAANSLTQLGTVANAHTTGETYRFEVIFDPSLGTFTVYEDVDLADARPEATTGALTCTDSAGVLTGNQRIGLFCVNCTVDFELFQVHRPACETVVDGTVRYSKFLNKRPASFEMDIGLDDDGSTLEFDLNDDVEIIIEDGTLQYRELFARVEKFERDPVGGTAHMMGRDISRELTTVEAVKTIGAPAALSTHITGIVDDNCSLCTSLDVKAGGGNYEGDYKQRSAWSQMTSLCRQLGYGMWVKPTGEVMATDTYVASGITIDNDDDVVLFAREETDMFDLCNTMRVVGSGAVTEARTDATSQGTYGKRGGPYPGGVIVDRRIAAAGNAQAEGDFWITNYKDPCRIVTVDCADFHELNVGETCTLNLDNLGIVALPALVTEKHYDDRNPWLTFVCALYAVTPFLRMRRDKPSSEGMANKWSSDALGYLV